MRCFDVFNGDADGICALHQLRLAEPVESTLVTGLRRDIERGKGLSAVDFCRRFVTGGGRSLAAGIDRLDSDRLDGFLDEFCRAWPS